MGIRLAFGEVSGVDYPGCRIRVRLDDCDGLESYWLPVPQRNTQSTQRRPLLPELGEQVAVLLDADGVGGVYLGGIYSTAEPPPVADETTDFVRFRDGTTATYDTAAGQLRVACIGAVFVEAATSLSLQGETITLQGSESITLTAPRIDLN